MSVCGERWARLSPVPQAPTVLERFVDDETVSGAELGEGGLFARVLHTHDDCGEDEGRGQQDFLQD